jgi:uncharacterized protein (DUF1697 family)
VRYAAFLRAVNLGRNRRVSGAELKSIFEELGLEDVATFRTSGNVVFDAPRDMTAKIEAALEKALGYDVGVFLRTARQLVGIANQDPFAGESGGKLQVLLLAKKPTAAARRNILALATEEDRLASSVREVYWLPKGGTMESALDMEALGKAIGAPCTMRTMGTIQALAAKYFA